MELSVTAPTLRVIAPGQLLFGRYRLETLIGQGGMGLVYSARDELLAERVALKFLPDMIHHDSAARLALREETLRARSLTHRSIVRIHEFMEDGNQAAISMELVVGANLTDRRLAKPGRVFSPADIEPWIGDLCEALDYAHGVAGVIHRDIKPANLLLSDGGEIKITDFGVSRQVADSLSRVSSYLGGTLLYMSPGQALGQPPTPADDIYALGATLYELLCGEPPFNTGDVRLQLSTRRPEPLSARLRRLSPGQAALPGHWEAAVMACLNKDPRRRPASAGELARRLLRSSPVSKPWIRRMPRSVWAPACALALCGGAAWLFFPGTGAPLPAHPAAPSDATRALGAWNFDGDGADASGNGLDAFSKAGSSSIRMSPEPTRDRFGRIDRALHFGGSSGLMVKGHPALAWSGDQPIVLCFWIRTTNDAVASNIIVARLMREIGGDDMLMVQHVDSHVLLTIYAKDLRKDVLHSTVRLEEGRWHHIAAQCANGRLALFIDGKPAGSMAATVIDGIPASETASLDFGGATIFTQDRFVGDLDDARLFRRALNQEDLARLSSTAAPPRIRATRASYDDLNDYAAIAKSEYGEAAQPADWEDFVRLHPDDVLSLCSDLRLDSPATNGVRLLWHGNKFWEGRRTFSANRMPGYLAGSYEAHAELGGNRLVLGSWPDMHDRIAVRLPPAVPQVTGLVAGETLSLPQSTQPRDVLAVRGTRIFTTDDAAPVRIVFSLRDGRQVAGVFVRADAASYRVNLGTEGTPEHVAAITISLAEAVDFSCVLTEGKLAFRAATRANERPVFRENSVIEGVLPSDVVGVRVEGFAKAELLTE